MTGRWTACTLTARVADVQARARARARVLLGARAERGARARWGVRSDSGMRESAAQGARRREVERRAAGGAAALLRSEKAKEVKLDNGFFSPISLSRVPQVIVLGSPSVRGWRTAGASDAKLKGCLHFLAHALFL